MRGIIFRILGGSLLWAEVVISEEYSNDGVGYAAEMSADDLISDGSEHLLAVTTSNFSGGSISAVTDGLSGNNFTETGYIAYGNIPATWVLDFDTVTYPNGYEIESIQSFMGWIGGWQTQANQTYVLEVSNIFSEDYSTLATVEYQPFSAERASSYETKVTITDDAEGILATRVDSIRVTLSNPTGVELLIREFDIIGSAIPGALPDPEDEDNYIFVTQPKTRAVIQRGEDNLADITVAGTYTGTLDLIEARMVLMDGYETGTATEWMELESADFAYSGVIPRVAAGGWYQIEVRGTLDGEITYTGVHERIGVGDIYVIAGQSNSANYGTNSYTLQDDRVSVRESLTTEAWRLAYAPFPIAGGAGGTAWDRLGDMLVAELDIPVGFISVGVGGSGLGQWINTGYTETRLKPAVQSFPANGFKAVLWHQGEADNVSNTSRDTYAANFQSMVDDTRVNAGWDVPWYVCEASYASNFVLSRETPVLAGQRLAANQDPLVYLGASTNEFQLENAAGGKLSDSVHFNAAGLADHAQQWKEILLGQAPITPENGNFENNADSAITTKTAALSDDEVHIVDPEYVALEEDGSYTSSLMVLDWRLVSSDGSGSPDGENGYMNPGSATYANAVDSINGGVMTNMDGPHVAFLSEGSAGNYFLSSSRALAEPNRLYTLQVALGVRDDASTFGGATVQILSEGEVVATDSFTKADLDTLSGADVSGSFTQVTVSWESPESLPAGQSLQYRIIKDGGAGTVLDIDDVQVSSSNVLSNYDDYSTSYWGANTVEPNTHPSGDYDGDGVSNGIEYYMGADPTVSNGGGFATVEYTATTLSLSLPVDPTVSLYGLSLWVSSDLEVWTDTGSTLFTGLEITHDDALWSATVDTDVMSEAYFRLSLD